MKPTSAHAPRSWDPRRPMRLEAWPRARTAFFGNWPPWPKNCAKGRLNAARPPFFLLGRLFAPIGRLFCSPVRLITQRRPSEPTQRRPKHMWLLLVAVACRGAWATHPAPASCHDLCLLSLCHFFIATDHAPASFPIRAWLFSNSSARKPQLPPTNSTGNTVCVAQVSLSKQDIKPHAQHLCRSPRIVPGIVRHLEHIGIHKPSRNCGTKSAHGDSQDKAL